MFKLLAVVLALIATASAACQQPPPNQAATINSTESYDQYKDCDFLPGLIIRNFEGDQNGILELPALVTISFTSANIGSRFGLVIDNTKLTAISLPNLVTIQGPTITVTNNAALTNLSIPKSVTFDVGQNSRTNSVVFAGNPNLVSTVLGITSTGAFNASIVIGGAEAGVTSQGQDAVAGSISFPFLQTANNIAIRTVGVNSNSAEDRLSNVEFPSLTSLNQGFALINTSVQSLIVSQKITVGANVDIEFNDRLSVFTFPFTAVNQLIYAFNGKSAVTPASISAPDVKTGFFRIEDNPTLGSISLDTLQYIGRMSIQRNTGLKTLSMPTAAYFQTIYVINGNGADGNRLNATLGAQVTNSLVNLQIQSNFFSDLTLNQLGNVTGTISIIDNSFTGGFFAQSSFTTTGAFSFSNNRGAITVTDISGLNAALSITINGNAGASGSSLLLTQLQALGAGVNTINSNTGYATLSFGQLVLVGRDNSSFVTFNSTNAYPDALQIDGNSFTTISTVGPTTRYSAPSISITNNLALQTVDLTNLVQAGLVLITGNNALTNFTAPQLSCVGTLRLTGLTSPSVIRALGLTKFYNIDTPADGTCAATIGSIMDTCAKVCYRCASQEGCYGSVTPSTGINGACLATTAVTSQALPSTCATRTAFQRASNPATAVPYTAAGGLYPDPTVIAPTTTTNGGGDGTTNNGAPTTGTTDNGAPTTGTTNNGAPTTGSTNNGGTGNTTSTNSGNGSDSSASMIQMTFAVVVSMTVLAALF